MLVVALERDANEAGAASPHLPTAAVLRRSGSDVDHVGGGEVSRGHSVTWGSADVSQQ